MKRIILPAVMLACAGFAAAQQGSTINFNLVQVNHYNGQEQAAQGVDTPGQRMIIDLQNPLSVERLLQSANENRLDLAPVIVSISGTAPGPGNLPLPWETGAVLRSASASDSFFVSSSLTGCPGTEVRPSVAVAFATGQGWSNPPIRFGPLTESAICPLGKGYQLEVSVKPGGVPHVRLLEAAAQFGRR